MSNLWLKIKVWTKITAVAAVLIYVILFVAKNSAKAVKPGPWFWFNVEPETTVLLLVLYSFLGGVLVAVLARTTFRTLRQIRDLQERQRVERTEKKMTEMEQKAAMLRSRPAGDGTVGGGESGVGRGA